MDPYPILDYPESKKFTNAFDKYVIKGAEHYIFTINKSKDKLVKADLPYLLVRAKDNHTANDILFIFDDPEPFKWRGLNYLVYPFKGVTYFDDEKRQGLKDKNIAIYEPPSGLF